MESRFKISRSKVPARRPWILTDRERPAFRGAYSSHELALHAVDNRVRVERGLPALPFFTTADVVAEMRRHVNAPCSVVPIMEPTA